MSTAREIRAEALARLAEIGDHGCEAASARAFEEGRLAALDALELGEMPFDPVIVHDGGPQRLSNHRPNCSLRDPKAYGSAAMTCTLRLLAEIPTGR